VDWHVEDHLRGGEDIESEEMESCHTRKRSLHKAAILSFSMEVQLEVCWE
jgi:hypothetical protein